MGMIRTRLSRGEWYFLGVCLVIGLMLYQVAACRAEIPKGHAQTLVFSRDTL